MKKIVLISMVGLSLLFSCKTTDNTKKDNEKGEEKYQDVAQVMETYYSILSEYLNGIDEANDAKGIVKALDNFNKKFKDLVPKLKNVDEKYPELKDVFNDTDNAPDILKDIVTNLKALMVRMQKADEKVKKYQNDPDVAAALDELGKLM